MCPPLTARPELVTGELISTVSIHVAPCLTPGLANLRPVPALACRIPLLPQRQSSEHHAQRERGRRAKPRVKHGATEGRLGLVVL